MSTLSQRCRLRFEEAKAANLRLTLTQVEEIIAEEEAKAYPPKLNKAQRGELIDAMVTVCGQNPATQTAPYMRMTAVSVQEILKTCPSLSVGDLRAKAQKYHAKFQQPPTPSALAKWWGALGDNKPVYQQITAQ